MDMWPACSCLLEIQKTHDGFQSGMHAHSSRTGVTDRIPAELFLRGEKESMQSLIKRAMAEIQRLRGRTVLGSGGPADVVEVNLHDTTVTDADLIRLRPFSGLQVLNLFATAITDAGLVHLQELSNLQRLDIVATHVTDAGLPLLRQLAQLSSLDLARNQITDQGLPHLKSLTGRRWLDLSHTRVTDAGVRHLQEQRPELRIIR